MTSPWRQRCRWGGLLLLPPTLNFFFFFHFSHLPCKLFAVPQNMWEQAQEAQSGVQSSPQCTLSRGAKTQLCKLLLPHLGHPHLFEKFSLIERASCLLCCYLCCLFCHCCPSSTALYLAPALGCAVWAPGVNFLHGNFSFCSPFLSAPVRDGNNESSQQQQQQRRW